MTRHAKDSLQKTSPADFFSKLLLIIFVLEMVDMWLLSPAFNRFNPILIALADAFFLVLVGAPFIWFMVIRPLPDQKTSVVSVWRSPSVAILVRLLAVIFFTETLVMLALPFFLPNPDPITHYVVDACLVTLLSAPLLWRILSEGQRRQIVSPADLLNAPLKLFILLLSLILVIDILDLPLVEYLSFGTSGFLRKVIDSSMTTLFISPLLWWLIIRPLRRAALSERTRADAIRAQVVEAIVMIDAEGKVDSFNPAAESIFGYSVAEITGRPAALLCDDGQQCVDEITRAATTMSDTGSNSPVTHEILGRRRDGSLLNMDVSISRIFLDKRQQYLAIMRDISSRKEMERVLRESEERFRSLSESSPVGIFHIDANERCHYTNKRWQEITGLTEAEALGSGWITVDHPEDKTAVCGEWRRSVTERRDFTGEFRLLTPQGEVRWVLARTAAIRSVDEDVIGYVGTYEDISERKKAEHHLQESLSMLTATLDSTADGILVVEAARHIQTFNQKYLDMWRIPRDHVSGVQSCGLLSFVKDQLLDPDAFVARVEELYDQPETTALDILRFKDGRVFERYTQPQMLDGRCIGRVWSFRDITATMETERSLRESEERFRQIFEQTEDAIILFRPVTCEVIDVNPTAEKLYGHSRAELLAGGVALLAGPADLAGLTNAIRGIDREGVSHLNNIVGLRKDGTEINVSMRGKLIPLQGEDVVYCTLRDITGRIRLEEESRDIQARLIQANKMTSLGLLVSGVAHEINNPNSFIMANSQLLAKVWEDADKILREYHRENGDFLIGGIPYLELRGRSPQLFAGITEGARRIDDIICNLKNFARQDRHLAESEVDINRVATAAVSLLLHQLNRYTENFHLDLADDLPYVRGSYQQLEQVVINLLLNAGQALPDKSLGIWITTGFDAAAGLVTLAVRDEGRGMEQDVSNRVMEPFFTTKLDSGGTGLGLSISLSIVKEHNGSLEFESEPGKGTTFTVKLPAGSPAVEEHTH
jgi:PAS domain S-box-containing protein